MASGYLARVRRTKNRTVSKRESFLTTNRLSQPIPPSTPQKISVYTYKKYKNQTALIMFALTAAVYTFRSGG